MRAWLLLLLLAFPRLSPPHFLVFLRLPSRLHALTCSNVAPPSPAAAALAPSFSAPGSPALIFLFVFYRSSTSKSDSRSLRYAERSERAAHGDATGKPAKRRKTSHMCEFNCPEGSEAAATHNCGTCGGMLCSSCHTAHSKMKMMKGHTVVSLEEYGGAAPIITCKKHVGKPLEVFCETCCMLVCLKCAVLDHKGNECVIDDLELMAAASTL